MCNIFSQMKAIIAVKKKNQLLDLTHRRMSCSLSDSCSIYVLSESTSFRSTLMACFTFISDVYISAKHTGSKVRPCSAKVQSKRGSITAPRRMCAQAPGRALGLGVELLGAWAWLNALPQTASSL